MERNRRHSVTSTLSTSNIEPNHQQMWNIIIHKINNVMPFIHLLCWYFRGCSSRRRFECRHRIFWPIPISPLTISFRTANELMNVNRIQILCIASSDLFAWPLWPLFMSCMWSVKCAFICCHLCERRKKDFIWFRWGVFPFHLFITIINFVNDSARTDTIAE